MWVINGTAEIWSDSSIIEIVATVLCLRYKFVLLSVIQPPISYTG